MPPKGPVIIPSKKSLTTTPYVAEKSEAVSAKELSSFFISARSGLEERERLPKPYEDRYPFLIDNRPIRFLSKDQRRYLDAIVMSYQTLKFVLPDVATKTFMPEHDTVATMIAEYLSALGTLLPSTKLAAVPKLAPEDLSFTTDIVLQPDLAYLLFGSAATKEAPRKDVIPLRYLSLETGQADSKQLTLWEGYREQLEVFYDAVNDTVGAKTERPDFWLRVGDETVGVLETRIIALIESLIVNRYSMFPTEKWLKRFKPYESIMMNELKLLLQYYAHEKPSKK